MKQTFLGSAKWIGVLSLALTVLAGCGGSSGDGGGLSPSSSSSGGVISGSVVKGPVSGAAVTAFAVNGDGTKGAQIGSAQTDAQGSFSMSVGNHSGAMMLQAGGGNYMDEATGTQMPMTSGLTCVIPHMEAGSTMSGMMITPLTSMAQRMAQNMAGGMTVENMKKAHQAMGQYFGAGDITTTRPMDPTKSGSGAAATPEMRNYGMTLAAMSKYAQMMGVTNSSMMVGALMDDAADGHMDGMMEGTSIPMMGDGGMMGGGTGGMMGGEGGMMGGTTGMMPGDAGTNGLATAMSNFVNSPMNRSGLTVQDMQSLINKLSSTSGQIQ